MISDKLYGKAFDYFEAKLWEKLYDTDLFAVQLSNDKKGYCSVMGRLGEHICLALYVGDEGLASFFDILSVEASNISEEEAQELMLSQNCIQCALETKANMFPDELKEFSAYTDKTGRKAKGRRKYIHFAKYRPFCIPWDVKDRKDISNIETALEAAIEVARKLKDKSKEELGFPDDDRDEMQSEIPLLIKSKSGFEWKTMELPTQILTPYHVPKLTDESIKEMKNYDRSGSIECKIFRMPFPSQGKESEQPRFPVLMMCVDRKTGFIVSKPNLITDENEDQMLFDHFADIFISQKLLPEKLIAFDSRTVNLLKTFCDQTKTPLIVEPTKLADNAFKDMLGFMGGMKF